jgi:hypothetical protein
VTVNLSDGLHRDGGSGVGEGPARVGRGERAVSSRPAVVASASAGSRVARATERASVGAARDALGGADVRGVGLEEHLGGAAVGLGGNLVTDGARNGNALRARVRGSGTPDLVASAHDGVVGLRVSSLEVGARVRGDEGRVHDRRGRRGRRRGRLDGNAPGLSGGPGAATVAIGALLGGLAGAEDLGVVVPAHILAAEAGLGAASIVSATSGGLAVKLRGSIEADSTLRVVGAAEGVRGSGAAVVLGVLSLADGAAAVALDGAATRILGVAGAVSTRVVDTSTTAVPAWAGVSGVGAGKDVGKTANTTGTSGAWAHRLGERSDEERVLSDIRVIKEASSDVTALVRDDGILVGKDTLTLIDTDPTITTNLELELLIGDLEGQEIILDVLSGDANALPATPVLVKDLEAGGRDGKAEAVINRGEDSDLLETSLLVPLLTEDETLGTELSALEGLGVTTTNDTEVGGGDETSIVDGDTTSEGALTVGLGRSSAGGASGSTNDVGIKVARDGGSTDLSGDGVGSSPRVEVVVGNQTVSGLYSETNVSSDQTRQKRKDGSRYEQ